MDPAEIIALLKRTDIFYDVPENILEQNISHLQFQEYSKDALIIKKNERGSSLFVIVSGNVKVHEGEYAVAHIGSGDFFGEMSLFDAGPRSMSVSALELVKVIRIDPEAFYNILQSRPDIIWSIISRMAQRLRAQNNLLLEELRSREKELQEQVAEQTQLYKEQKERAERSEKFKQQFLANMSHEIRTPMNVVIGLTNILLEKNPRPDQLNHLGIIKKSGDHLLAIINDILDMSKIEAGKMEIEEVEFSPRETIDLVYLSMKHKAEEKGLLLQVHYDEEIPPVLVGDPLRLDQVLVNLVGNAIKFTERGSVTLKVTLSDPRKTLVNEPPNQRSLESSAEAGCTIQFSVTDTGIGMTKEELGRVFDLFTQGSSETSRKFGGTGLGLSISKQIVELQKGKITVESQPGIGSTFSFAINYKISDKSLSAKAGEISSDMLEGLKGLKILLAEDNEFNQIVAIELLQLKLPDIKINVAENGLQAVEKLRSNDYDLILMDVQMPVMDGYEATRKIRSEFTSPKKEIPILALTASVLRSDIELAMKAGMNDYIGKPFSIHDLMRAMSNVVTNKRSLRRIDTSVGEEKTEIKSSVNHRATDLTFLRQFTEGNEARMQKYIHMYLDSMPSNMEKISHAIGQKDFEGIRRIIHSMKVHFTYMGMKEAKTISDSIERDCVEKTNLAGITELFSRLSVLCKKSKEELGGVQ